jgi:Lon protease-like protein
MARLPDLPLFPLPLVLLPGELLPLHIFEPRYRELVARCLAGPEPFCVVLEDDAGVREVGCLARDLTVLERLADGRLNIVVSGGEPVQLGPIDDDVHSYLSAEALVLEDEEEPLAEDEMEAALAAYRALLSEIGRDDPEPLSTQPRLSYALGARIDVGLQVGQALLESRSESARLALITEALEQGRHSLRIAAERERRAVRNGKVEPSESDVP